MCIKQYYFNTGFIKETKESPAIRLQMIKHYDDKNDCIKDYARVTFKGPGKISRPEFEYNIPKEDAEGIAAMASYLVSKCRYNIDFDGQLWEVDQFFGPLRGLWLAELELKSEDQEIKIPEWILEEVTENIKYSNFYMAQHGKP